MRPSPWPSRKYNHPMDALILFAHGSRDKAWFTPFDHLRSMVQGRSGTLPVRLAYLELAQPDLPTIIAELVGQGCRAIRVVPVFLAAGAHVRNDLPKLVDAAKLAHPGLSIELTHAIGENFGVLNAIADCALKT